MAPPKKPSGKSIIQKNKNINLGSRKIQPQYSPGKSNFLDSQQRATFNQYRTKAHNNHTYNAVVIALEKGDIPNILGLGNLGSTDADIYVVRAVIPELHSMYPDPFEFNYHPSIVGMYPTFSGKLDQIPLIGSTIGVSFIDENNKFQEYGNGKIVSFIQNPVDGSQIGGAGEASNRAIRTAVGKMIQDYAACPFLELEGSAPTDEQPELFNQDNSVGENNPQTINSSFQSRVSSVRHDRTGINAAPPGTERQTVEEQNLDTSSTTNLPDCKKVSSLEEYIAAYASAVPSGSQDPNAEYPAWPLVWGAFDPQAKEIIPMPQPPADRISPIATSEPGFRKLDVRQAGKKKKNARNHAGMDIRCPVGTPVLATLPGTVVKTENPTNAPGLPTTTELSLIIIRHDGYGGKGEKAIHSCYFHMHTILVKKGQIVDRGTCLGLSGGAVDSNGSGGTTGPHLHFELRTERRGKVMSPRKFLSTKWKKKGG